MGLRLYLAIAFAVFAIVISASFGIVAGRIVYETIVQRIGSVLERSAVEVVATIDQELKEREDDLDNYAVVVRHAGSITLADLEWIGVDALTRGADRAFGCDWAAAADLAGKVMVASSAGPPSGASVAAEPWFDPARNETTVWSRTEAASDGRPWPRLVIARPLRDRDQKPYAVLVCALGPDWARTLIERAASGIPGPRNASDVLVLDAAGAPVMLSVHVPADRIPAELTAPGAAAAWRKLAWNAEGEFVVASAQAPGNGPTARLGWRIVVRRAATDAMQPAAVLRDRVYAFSAAIALIAGLVGFFAASRVVLPLRSIAEAARRIGAGELGVHIPEFQGYREIAMLSDSLRNMLAALRGNEARLAALNESLDQRVRQRTSEIAEAHEALARQESRLRAVIDTATDGVLIVGDGHRIETFNPACEAIFGWKAEEIVGRPVSELIGGDARSRRGGGGYGFDDLVKSLEAAGDAKGHVRTVRARRRDGSGFPLEVSISRTLVQTTPIYVAIVRDVTEAVRAHEELFALATKDSLTGLRNRRYFLEGAETEFARSRRHGRAFSLMLIDADHFKRINDTYGHDAGDRVLQAIAEVTTDCLREVDLIGRLGGEEFAVAMPDCELATALVVADRLRQQIAARMMETEAGVFTVTVSIGVAGASADDKTLNQMLRRSDQALYAAKHGGRNQVAVADA